MFSETFQNASVFARESKPHGAEYRRHRSPRCPRIVSSFCGVGTVITGTLLQNYCSLSNTRAEPEPTKHELLIVHRCGQQRLIAFPSLEVRLFFFFTSFFRWRLLKIIQFKSFPETGERVKCGEFPFSPSRGMMYKLIPLPVGTLLVIL